MDMPRPTEHHRKLEKLAGRWEGTEVMHPSPWDARGGTAIGRTTSRVDLSGFALISDYAQERDGEVTFTGHGVWTYDRNEGSYLLHWFDCMGSPPEVFKGRFDKDVLTVAHGGPGIHARLTYDLSQPGRLTSRMDMSTDGKEWKTLFEGTYERKT
jgi:uncharacterized protein YodC (DUF2158 family)